MRVLDGCLLLVCLIAPACAVDPTLHCELDRDCTRAGQQGTCQGGHCAFRDSACATDWRWDETASADLAGQCTVPNGCGGEEHVLLSAGGRVEAQTQSFDPRFLPEKAVDGNHQTSWLSTGPNPDRTPTFFRWIADSEACISEIEIIGNGQHADPAYRQNFGFAQVTIEIFSGDHKVFSGLELLPGTPDPEVRIETGNVLGSEVMLWFFGHENAGNAGFAELTVNGLR